MRNRREVIVNQICDMKISERNYERKLNRYKEIEISNITIKI
jgi:hypothetical protein